MSWDVYLFSAPPGTTSVGELPKDFKPPSFERAAAIRRISELFPNSADFSDPSWGTIHGDGWSIEVSLGSEAKSDGAMLHIRGGGDPVAAALAIASALELTPVDCSSGEILTAKKNCFTQWRAYRDQIVSGRE